MSHGPQSGTRLFGGTGPEGRHRGFTCQQILIRFIFKICPNRAIGVSKDHMGVTGTKRGQGHICVTEGWYNYRKGVIGTIGVFTGVLKCHRGN